MREFSGRVTKHCRHDNDDKTMEHIHAGNGWFALDDVLMESMIELNADGQFTAFSIAFMVFGNNKGRMQLALFLTMM